VAGLEASQNKAQGSLDQIDKTAQAIVRDTGTIRDQQSQLDQGLQQEGTHIRQGLSQLEKNQGQLQESVNRVETTTNTVKEMADVDAKETQKIQGQQAELQQGMVQEGGKIRQTLAGMEENQDQLYGAVNNVQVGSNTVASNTTTLMEQQATLQRVTHQNQAQLVGSLDRMGANQKTISQQAVTLKEGQGDMSQLITHSQNAVAGKVDAVSGQQGELKDSIEGVAATTQAISQDTRELKQGQASLSTDVQSGQSGIEQKVGQLRQTQASLNRMFISEKTHLDGELKSIGKSQAGLQDGLSDQKNMSQDMAEQIGRMQQDQTKMSQTMDQQQQAWQGQSGDLAKRVAALEESLGHVDQNVSSLQTNLVSQITELTKVMKALQAQGGAQIAQLTDDMKAFSGTLKEIQATQSNLARRIDQVGTNQAQQSKGFLTALEKLQKQTQPASAIDPVEVEPQDVDVVK
jgi:chromosome segregation ATPase